MKRKLSPISVLPLLNKLDIGQAADKTTVLLFRPRMLILLTTRGNYFKSYLTGPSFPTEKKQFQFTYIPLPFD